MKIFERILKTYLNVFVLGACGDQWLVHVSAAVWSGLIPAICSSLTTTTTQSHHSHAII